MTRSGAELAARVLHPGAAEGRLLVLGEPLSFWGGTDVATGRITDVHHPQRGAALAGRVVVMPSVRGSSSSSSVLAEQIRTGVAPAALVLGEPDAVLAIGALVAAELYGRSLPILLVEPHDLGAIPADGWAAVTAGPAGGSLRVERR